MKGLKRIDDSEIAYQLDGLRFTLHAVRTAFVRIEAFCRLREMDTTSELTFSECFNVLSDCWTVIDQTDRARAILESIRGFKRGKQEKRQFLDSARTAHKFRNVFQHFGTAAKAIPEKSPSMMGTLCWVTKANPQLSLLLILTSGVVDTSFPSLVFDRLESKFVEDFQFNAAGHGISISSLNNSCGMYSDFLEEMLAEIDAHSDGNVAGMIIGFEVQSRDSIATA